MEINNPTKKYKTTDTVVYSCQYHVIFTTKYRRKVISETVEEKLKAIIYEKQAAYGYEIIEIETMPDHVHLLIDCNPQNGVCEIVRKIKGVTSRIIRETCPEVKSRIPCLWTRSKFISSVGAVSIEIVKKYIEEQKNR